MEKFHAIGSIQGSVSSVAWHESCLNANEISMLASSPNPSSIGRKLIATDYSFRLSSLLLSLTRTKDGLKALSTKERGSKWATLLLDLCKYGSANVQRPILKILASILNQMDPTLVVAPSLMRRAAGSGSSAAVSTGRGASGLFDYLSHIVGVAWWCSSNDAANGVAGDVNSVLSQFLPEFISTTSVSACLSYKQIKITIS